jgi:nucleoside-diphosphate-sugar epimerase
MFTLRSVRLSGEIVVRIVSDALLINMSILVALAGRFFYLVAFEPEAKTSFHQLFLNYVKCYRNSAWLLTLICLIIFTLSGFYTFGRAYRGRYKALVVAQAVSLSYLLFGFLQYFLSDALALPRGAWVLALLITMGALIAARVWSRLWRKVAGIESQFSEQRESQLAKGILLIGGAGYIGSALLPKLLAKDYKVRLLDLFFYGTEPIEGLLSHPNLEVIHADFRQIDKVVEAMRGVDAVIHLGAIVGDPACALDHELTIEINLMATRMIAEVAKASKVRRFIFASTCSVYGANDEILDEHSLLNPVSLYARSKIASEQVLMNMASGSFAPSFLRFGTIYGLSGRARFDLVVNLLTAKALVDGEITISGGDQWRPFLHVDDAALAVLNTLEAPFALINNEVFNVGSDQQNHTIQQVGEIIHRMIPAAQLINTGSDGDRRNYRVNFSKIRNTLGFVPQWTLEQGVRQVAEIIKSGKIQDYRAVRYSNVKFLNDANSSQLIRPTNGWAKELMHETASASLPLAKAAGASHFRG